MSSYNHQIKNEPTIGNVVEYFQRIKNLIPDNDGSHKYTQKNKQCYHSEAPLVADADTELDLTTRDHDISQVNDSFANLKVEVTIKSDTALTITDPKHLYKGFIGLKDSAEITDKMELYSNGTHTKYLQDQHQRESFAYHTMLPRQYKVNKYTHSLYEKVQYLNDTMAGTYFNMADLAGGKSKTLTFDINIPYCDWLALQAFKDYPTFLFGILKAKFKLNGNSLVWCVVDPRNTAEVKEMMEDDDLTLFKNCLSSSSCKFSHQFTQINDKANIMTTFSFAGKTSSDTASSSESDLDHYDLTSTSNAAGIILENFRILEFRSNMCGYTINDAAKQIIAGEINSHGLRIPSQQLERQVFSSSATSSGFSGNIGIPLWNVSAAGVVFPKTGYQRTVLENPCYRDVQLKIDGTLYPDEPLDTLGPRFYQSQIVACDLDGLEVTKEFEDSITMNRNDKSNDGARYKNTLRDATSFIAVFPTERSGGGYVFDGLNSCGANVAIDFKGTPIYRGANDTYYNVDSTGSTHPPPPELWLTRDTFFEYIPNKGLVYVDDWVPPELCNGH